MDFKILGSLNGLKVNDQAASYGQNAAASTDFGSLVKTAVNTVMDNQRAAADMTVAAASGQDIPMQEVIQAVGKAELTLQTMITIRDRAVEAYQEISRMPI